jgi:hypothetical protein
VLLSPRSSTVLFDTLSASHSGTFSGYSGPLFDGSTLLCASFTTTKTKPINIAMNLTAHSPNDAQSVSVYLVGDDGTGGGDGLAGSPDTGNVVMIGTIQDSALVVGGITTITINGATMTLQVPTQNNVYWLTLVTDDGPDTGQTFGWAYNVNDAHGVGTAGQAVWIDAQGSSSPINGSGYQGPFVMKITQTG